MGGRQLWLSCFFAALVLGVVFTPARAQIIGEEGLTEEQQEYFRNIFLQYDEDSDGYISMEENLKQDKVIADDEGKPFDEEHSKLSFERTDYDKDGYVSFEEMTMPRPPEEQCKQLYGDYAEYDGVRSCRCVTGYTADINGTCIKGSTEVCTKQFGPHSDFDGANNCMCKKGYIPDVNGTCVSGNDSACTVQFGEHSHYDQVNNTCVCNTGSVPDTNGTCVPASNELCQDWFGPNTRFDGQNNCVCKKGFVYADGECFRGSNKVCSSIIAGSKFDGQNNCKCRRGYEIDESRGMCVRRSKEEASGGDGDKADAKPLPPQGTVTISVVEAKYLPKMDKHTKCDPFAVITLGKSHKRTKTVKKTYAPEWGESFTLTYNESDATPSEVLIELWDEDVAKTKEYIGHVEISLAELMSDDFQGWLDLQGHDGALVRGFGKNISMVNLQVKFSDQLPYIPFWEPILAERPEWVLQTARGIMGVWTVLGILVFFVLNKSKDDEDDKAGEGQKEEEAKKNE